LIQSLVMFTLRQATSGQQTKPEQSEHNAHLEG
jgi:hypothetical protein